MPGFGGVMTRVSRLSGIPAFLGDAKDLKRRFPLCKIVATIGPSSEQIVPMKQVFEAGMRIMRINFSHATYEEANLRVKNLNACRGVNIEHGHDATGTYTNMRAIMLDTQGPEIRTGSFDGVKEVELKAGQEVRYQCNVI
ncbi:hypothetical protein EON64_19005 [archaeon]|nr:MAG: hypothetical protein EON64_19005 [archaeon]